MLDRWRRRYCASHEAAVTYTLLPSFTPAAFGKRLARQVDDGIGTFQLAYPRARRAARMPSTSRPPIGHRPAGSASSPRVRQRGAAGSAAAPETPFLP